MALKIKPKAPTPAATVTKEMVESGKVVATDTTPADVAGSPVELTATVGHDWCSVGFEASYTHNLGDYRSARVAISITIPSPADEINGVFDFAKEWVNEKLTTSVEELIAASEE